jgi:multidrug efflux pump subunit AcrA (membrane-fusion protein)
MKTRLALLAMTALLVMITASCSKKQEAAPLEKTPVVSHVPTETVKTAAVADFYEAVGTVRSKTTTTLSSKVVGSVISMRVREGDRVRAGQLLAEIDSRDARTQADKAQAGLREAQTSVDEVEKSIRAAEAARAAAEANRNLAAATFRRYQALLDRKSVSQQEFDEAQARYKVAEAEVERAKRMLESIQARRNQVTARVDQARADVAGAQVYVGYSRITAPISGVVTMKQADVGTLAAPGTPLLTIEDGSSFRLEAAVEESRIRDVRLNQPVIVLIDALGDDTLSGRVVEIVPATDPSSRSYTVRIELPARPLLRSGLFGKARFATGERQAITIPQKAIVQRGQLTGVYVIDSSGIARLRLITIGKATGERVEVLSGLSDDDRVVTDANAGVSDGSKVQQVKP